MIPTLDGVALFGATCLVSGPVASRAREMSGTFGADGVEGQDAGGRGALTSIYGTLAGSGPYGLVSAETAVRSYQNGNTYVFTDALGNSWPNVRLVTFIPRGRVGQTANGVFYRRFTATLQHLSF